MINELELKLQNETGVYERAHTKYPEYFDAGGYSFNDGHLGGTNVVGCPGTYYHPNLWKFIFEKFNIETMVDVGCGFGFAIKFIKDKVLLKLLYPFSLFLFLSINNCNCNHVYHFFHTSSQLKYVNWFVHSQHNWSY